jgi:hypothetical protein
MKVFTRLLLIAAPELATAADAPTWTTLTNEHFSISIPASWTIRQTADRTNAWKYATSTGTNLIFEVSVWRGTGFQKCFCAPWDRYTVIRRMDEEVRAIRIRDTRTLKIAGRHYSLDIHASDGTQDSSLIDRVLASVRMKN